jgi:MFS family permease
MSSYLRGVYLRLAGVVTLVVMLALAANAFLSHRIFEAALAPQLAAKVTTAGASLRSLVLRAVENGVRFESLHGVTERFTEVIREIPEVDYLALADTSGRVMHESAATPADLRQHFERPDLLKSMHQTSAVPPVHRVGDLFIVSLPIVTGDGPLGMLHLGVPGRFVDKLVFEMLLDVVVILVVALFFTVELLHYIAGARLDATLRDLGETFERGGSGNFVLHARPAGEQAFKGLLQMLDATLGRLNAAYAALARDADLSRRLPAHERQAGVLAAQAETARLAERFRFGRIDEPPVRGENQLAKIRAPLFVFILAEELTRSFLPGYVGDLLVPVPGVSTEILIGLPIALFMLIVAIGQPFLGVYCERVGHRKAMLMGAGTAAVGLLASALAHSVLDLLVWRSLCALGYATVFVAAQAYVLDHAPPAQRAKSFALFVGAIMAATVCGPSIGGILADNVGVRPTFALAAVLAALSMLVIAQLPAHRPASADRVPTRLPTLREIGSLLGNRRFMTITALAAMPAKILLTGVCFYLVPLHVVDAGSTQSMAGRLLMTYAVVMVLMTPLAASLATTSQRMHWLVGGGLVVSGLGAAAVLVGQGVGTLFLAVVLVGIGQSMSISAQSALVAENCAAEIRRLGEGVVYGVYRLLERIGNALGPLIAAVLVMVLHYRASFVAIGIAVALFGVAFLLATLRAARSAPLASQPRFETKGEIA